MDQYERPLYRFLLVLVGDGDAATDCAQDTFIRAYENLQRGKPVNAGWLYKVARNRAIDEIRRRRKFVAGLDAAERISTASTEMQVEMREAFARLSPDDRAVLYLSAVEGLTGAEIAAALGLKHSTVRMRICRARERFRLAYGAAT